MSLLVSLKNKTFRTLAKFVLERGDVIELCKDLEYPDLINELVKRDGVKYFSDVCHEYLNDTQHLKSNSTMLIRILLEKYTGHYTKSLIDDRTELLLERILSGAIQIKSLGIGNVVKRDDRYRKMIRTVVSDIESVDVNVIVALLVKLNHENLIENE